MSSEGCSVTDGLWVGIGRGDRVPMSLGLRVVSVGKPGGGSGHWGYDLQLCGLPPTLPLPASCINRSSSAMPLCVLPSVEPAD